MSRGRITLRQWIARYGMNALRCRDCSEVITPFNFHYGVAVDQWDRKARKFRQAGVLCDQCSGWVDVEFT